MSAPLPNPTVEVKVVVASIVTLLAGLGYAVLNAVQESPGVLAGLPAPVQFVVLAALPALLTFLAGYAKTSNRA